MSESRLYQQAFDYLSGDYPEGTKKAEKRLVRKKSMSFRLIEGELYFTIDANCQLTSREMTGTVICALDDPPKLQEWNKHK